MKTYPLKRCPFCGGKAKLLEDRYIAWVVCMTCFAETSKAYPTKALDDDIKEKAARKWNRRKDWNS